MENKVKIGIVIFIVAFIVLFFPIIKMLFVSLMSPFFGCGEMGSAIGFVNRGCECSGMEMSSAWIGGGQSICLGKCVNCTCWKSVRINGSISRKNVECE